MTTPTGEIARSLHSLSSTASSRLLIADEQPRGMGLRAGSPDDAEQAGAICYEAFKTIAEQHGFPPDFPSAFVAIDLMRLLLSRSDIHAASPDR